MAKKKKPGLSRRALNFIFRSNKNLSSRADIRAVYFGLRIRILALITLVMAITLSILTLIMYVNQQHLIEDLNSARAKSLTRILSGPAEFYLDKDMETSKEEQKIKYQTIERESKNFIAYNDDIVKIILTNERGQVRYSTSKSDFGLKNPPDYISKSLKAEEDKLIHYDFTLKKKKRPSPKKTEDNRYRAIVFPIILHKGDLIDILSDFNRFNEESRKAGKTRKQQIYRYLWGKYRDALGERYDPDSAGQDSGKDLIVKAGDVDFLFLGLFRYLMKKRNRPISRVEQWKWNDAWLMARKKERARAIEDDNPAKAKDSDDLIVAHMNELSQKLDSIRRLGVLALVFDVDAIKRTSSERIRQASHAALAMMVAGIIAIFIVLNYMIKNLKKLERWAISVSGGNLNEKIFIKARDEIGRLGDISNHMIDEIKEKYNLEKFVSKSTKSMIRGARTGAKKPDLGVIGRRKYAFIFSDVRGFTSFSERNDPSTVVEILNFYLDLQSNIVKGNKGDIDDYVGDQIMAHFSGEKRADRAIDTAVKIMREIEKVNTRREKEGLPVFQVGIGIHEGDVVTGNIGSSFRMDFACVGDAVNLTSRLCSSAKPGEILASQAVFDQASKQHAHTKGDSIEVKGKDKKIPVVRVSY